MSTQTQQIYTRTSERGEPLPHYEIPPLPGTGLMLTGPEQARLKKCEAVIERGLKSFMEVASAILTIKEDKLYRAQYPTFEAYCRQRWDFGSRRAQQLMAGAGVVNLLAMPPEPAAVLPTSEKQVRPLVGLPKSQQKEVWNEAVRTAPAGKTVPARHVQMTADRLNPKPLTAEKAEITKTDEAKTKAPLDGPDKWPAPNGVGVYSEVLAQKVTLSVTALAYAEIVLLQIGDRKWISAGRWEFFKGGKLTKWPQLETLKGTDVSREEALRATANRIRFDMENLLQAPSGVNPAYYAPAIKIRKWAEGLMGQQTAEEKEPAQKPTKETKKEKVADAVEVLPTNGKLDPALAQTAKKIYQLGSPFSSSWNFAPELTKKGCVAIARWHLAEIVRLTVALRQAEDVAPKTSKNGHNKISAAGRAMMVAKARARWKRAKANVRK